MLTSYKQLSSVANVLQQSNNPVPAWMLSLPKPSKMKRKALKKSPVERKSVANVAGRGIGRGQAIRIKEMKEGSKRRKAAEVEVAQNSGDDDAMSIVEA